jgi:hypothetical protein
MEERCPDCGALFVLVGLRHRCMPRPESTRSDTLPDKTKVLKRKVRERVQGKKQKKRHRPNKSS